MMATLRFSVTLPEIVELTLSLALQPLSLKTPIKPDSNPKKVKYFTSPCIAQWMGSNSVQGVATQGFPTTKNFHRRDERKKLCKDQGLNARGGRTISFLVMYSLLMCRLAPP